TLTVPVGAPILQVVTIGSNVGLGSVSLQGAAAGFLGAGFMRLSIRNRPMAMAVAAKSGAHGSRFEKVKGVDDNALGHFE
ncbi:MAG: hypothetical protein ACHQ2Y_10100, partial [Candidatus Lutacidiplasmatales archaeon]